MTGCIIYKGKYGATRQYAEWASEELQLPLFKPENLETGKLVSSGFVLIGSSVYMGKLLMKDWLHRHVGALKNKKLYLFIVCGTPDSDSAKQQKIIHDNIPAPLLRTSAIFFLPGRLIRDQLSWKDALFLKMGARLEKDPVKKQAMLHDIDGVKKGNMEPLLQAVCGAFLAPAAI